RLRATGVATPAARGRAGARARLAGPGPRLAGARRPRAAGRSGPARGLRDPRREARLAGDAGPPACAAADARRNPRRMKQVEIHTDGACLGNPGPGGWAALLRYGARERELV